MSWIDFFKKEAKKQKSETERSPETLIGTSATEIYGGYLAEEYLGELVNIRAVSYTHLTLPTICSV